MQWSWELYISYLWTLLLLWCIFLALSTQLWLSWGNTKTSPAIRLSAPICINPFSHSTDVWCVRVTADSSKISIQQKSSKLLLTTQKTQFSTASSGFIHSCWLLPHPVCLVLAHTLQKCQQSNGHLLNLAVLMSWVAEWINRNSFTTLVSQA